MYQLDDYDFDLPEDRIAQRPAEKREESRLLVLNRSTGEILHRRFHEIGEFLFPGDLLVINDTKVVPARLFGKKEGGGKIEILILDYPGKEEDGHTRLTCLARSSKRVKPGSLILFEGGLKAVVDRVADGMVEILFSRDTGIKYTLFRFGKTPLPPYIRIDDENLSKNRYQTVYAESEGAVAAPTAGLHFSRKLIGRIREKGVGFARITLHVGYGTFAPVRVEDIREHRMHAERYLISTRAAGLINETRKKGGRILAVGTTCVRTLEYSADSSGVVRPGAGLCNLFIYPGYRFKAVDAMITNFHLPKSTLLMLVSAFAGRERIMKAYEAAVKNRYRFYSFGDAMLIV